MCNRCHELEKELKGKLLSDKDFFHSLLYDAGIMEVLLIFRLIGFELAYMSQRIRQCLRTLV